MTHSNSLKPTKKTESQPRGIRAWPKSERPRERLLANGAGALSTAELLAILIGHGDRSRTALDLARELLLGAQLSTLTQGMVLKVKGVGPAKAARILAAKELGRRISCESKEEVVRIQSAQDVVQLMKPQMTGLLHEAFYVIAVDVKNRPLTIQEISRGGSEGVSIHPREIFQEAIRGGGSGVICVHNHPSGDPSPSPEDRALTTRLQEGAKLLGLRFLDHVIIAGGRQYSFAEQGMGTLKL